LRRTLGRLGLLSLVVFALPAGSRGQEGHGHPPAPAAAAGQTPAGQSGQQPGGDDDKPEKKPKEPRQGLPIEDLLVRTHCARCHTVDDRGMMSRLSYERKSPEGWSESLKRMVRLYELKISPADAKQIVRYLADHNGLTRSEAERSLYESERRVHWSEEERDQDFRQACAQCHTLGRVLAQARDEEEWQLLRSTHVAMFPLSRGQMGGGPPRDPEELARMRQRFMAQQGQGQRGGARGRGRAGATAGGANQGGNQADGAATPPPIDPFQQQLDRGDKVLQKLAKEQPLLTPEWQQWALQRREVPMAGTWTVAGHEVGRGDLSGTCTIARTDVDEYDVTWDLHFSNGDSAVRKGKGLLYSGYSWRGRGEDPKEGGGAWREVLLLDEPWQRLKGRLFRGDYDEIGCDVELHRHIGVPRVLAAVQHAITVPSLGAALDVLGEAFPADLKPADFHLGAGVTVTGAQRQDERRVRLTVDVAPNAECGPRIVSYGADPGRAVVQLYDQVDYIRVTPAQGFARTGGTVYPKQFERFEAIAVHRGKDKKAFTDDDVDLFTVKATFHLEEFAVRENDDDLQYVGTIDPATGTFTPSGDGPNVARKWQANNVGDVYVVAEASVDTPVRPPDPKKPEPPEKPAGGDKPGGDKPAEPPAAKPTPPPPPPELPADVPQGQAPVLQQIKLVGRAHLLVTVPLYTRWTRLDWSDR
jgi:quinohemoprotein amine dehydrogenase